MRKLNFEKEILNVSADKFNDLAAKIFAFQHQNCSIYQKWCHNFDKNQSHKNPLEQFPFLPVSFFKSHTVASTKAIVAEEFLSSTTSSELPSKHIVPYPDFYKANFLAGFKAQYGNINDFCILGLLPSYLERGNSSLVYMVAELIKQCAAGSGFYLHNYNALKNQLVQNETRGIKSMLIGVSYALLDLAEIWPDKPLHFTTIVETGGMKGKREEITKPELHAILSYAFKVENIHSEYGMTELMSQAWSVADGKFFCPPWMQVFIRETTDPGNFCPQGKSGQICIIDLGNLYSCSFIATDDIGKLHGNGSFEVLGRMDFSDVRGCNLMVQ